MKFPFLITHILIHFIILIQYHIYFNFSIIWRNNNIQQLSLIISLPTCNGTEKENINLFIVQLENVAKLETWDNPKKFF